MSRQKDRKTLDLFEVPTPVQPLPASMDFRAQVSAMVGRLMKESDGDRHEIAARMSRLTNTEVTKYMLDAYAAEGREAFNIPFWIVAAFEVATNTHEMGAWYAGIRGGRLLVGREVLAAELGKLERIKEDAGRRAREIRKLMGEDDA